MFTYLALPSTDDCRVVEKKPKKAKAQLRWNWTLKGDYIPNGEPVNIFIHPNPSDITQKC